MNFSTTRKNLSLTLPVGDIMEDQKCPKFPDGAVVTMVVKDGNVQIEGLASPDDLLLLLPMVARVASETGMDAVALLNECTAHAIGAEKMSQMMTDPSNPLGKVMEALQVLQDSGMVEFVQSK